MSKNEEHVSRKEERINKFNNHIIEKLAERKALNTPVFVSSRIYTDNNGNVKNKEEFQQTLPTTYCTLDNKVIMGHTVTKIHNFNEYGNTEQYIFGSSHNRRFGDYVVEEIVEVVEINKSRSPSFISEKIHIIIDGDQSEVNKNQFSEQLSTTYRALNNEILKDFTIVKVPDHVKSNSAESCAIEHNYSVKDEDVFVGYKITATLGSNDNWKTIEEMNIDFEYKFIE